MRNLQFHQRVFLAIFPLYSFFRFDSRSCKKSIIIRYVFKNNVPVISRVNIFFHLCLIFLEFWGCKNIFFHLNNLTFFKNFNASLKNNCFSILNPYNLQAKYKFQRIYPISIIPQLGILCFSERHAVFKQVATRNKALYFFGIRFNYIL